jgi:hypothetical protein
VTSRWGLSVQWFDQLANTAQGIVKLYGSWSKSEYVGLLVVLTTALGATIRGAVWLRTWLRERRSGSALEREARSIGRQTFSESDIASARRNFVEQSCSVLDPSKEVSLRSTVSVQEPVLGVLKRELRDGQSRHILVLADSGMGKTTLLLNLLAMDLDLPARKRKGLVAVSLALDDALDRLSEIKSKSDKVLLLDAFDEDAEAIVDHRSRLAAIMKEARDFNALVMTCRTQFFSHDEEIPREVGVVRIAPRPAGQDQAFVFRKLYLLPYSEAQTKKYLHKAIPWWHPSYRRKAAALASRIKDLAARPMLLALVPSLVRDGHDAREIFHLYRFMVEKWFQRERTWMNRDSLREASKLLAVDMVMKRHRRGSESVPPDELSVVLQTLAEPLERRKFESRSLLNRDHAAHLKFSHRSIMEYFFVVAAIEGQFETLNVEWTDQMREFLFSWGRSAATEEEVEVVRTIFRKGLTSTKILPVVRTAGSDLADASTDADALASLLKLPSPRAVASGFPQPWIRYTLTATRRDSFWNVSELADGIAWQVPQVPTQHPSEQHRYFNMDNIFGNVSESPETIADRFPWRVLFPSPEGDPDSIRQPVAMLPTLDQFTNLALGLAQLRKMHVVLDCRERYWIRSVDRKSDFLVSARRTNDPAVDFSADRGSHQLCVLPHSIAGQGIVIALHRCTSPNTRAIQIRASGLGAVILAEGA